MPQRPIIEIPIIVAHLNNLYVKTQDANTNCTCDECSPELYQGCKSHKILDVPVQLNQSSKPIFQPLSRHIINGGTYEPLSLARKCIAYFDVPQQELNQTQINAVSRFHSHMAEWGHMMDDASSAAIPTETIMELLDVFNDLFFMSANKYRFVWKAHTPGYYGYCEFPTADTPCTIVVNSVDYRELAWKAHPHRRMLDRISILLHEEAHALFHTYACRKCDTYSENVGVAGHGRAWQLLAAKLEEKGLELLGIPIFLGTFDSLVNWVQVDKQLPSICDLMKYKLKSYDMEY